MDRAYEDNKTRALAEEHGFNVVVPPKKNRKDPWEYDKELYKKRNQVERYFLSESSVSEKFLHATISSIQFFFLLSCWL